jgi:bifunctional non-homologous end joining protein LigD
MPWPSANYHYSDDREGPLLRADAVPCDEKLPEGPDWEYELKLDGYRAVGIKTENGERILSRSGKNFSGRFPTLARALELLPNETVIDGEIVAVDDHSRPSFNSLQNFERARVLLYAFDLLVLAGDDMTRRPLDEGRKLLRKKVMPRLSDLIRFSETFESSAMEMIATVREHELEGVVAKAPLESLPARPTVRRLGQTESEPFTGSRDRRLRSDFK